jgi:hypothetical protein
MFLAQAIAFALSAPPRGTAGQAVPSSPCKFEENCECAAPGITLRWKAAYCMYLAETDELENEDVQRCLDRADPEAVRKLHPCEQNAHWKALICRIRYKTSKQAQQCIRDKTFVPRFVEFGPGSDASSPLCSSETASVSRLATLIQLY